MDSRQVIELAQRAGQVPARPPSSVASVVAWTLLALVAALVVGWLTN